MNAKINNSNGWILCPSKSFPNKFYYFNGLTGETMWSCNLHYTDRRNLKLFTNEDVTGRSYRYPEPKNPPGGYYTFGPNLNFSPLQHRPNVTKRKLGESNNSSNERLYRPSFAAKLFYKEPAYKKLKTFGLTSENVVPTPKEVIEPTLTTAFPKTKVLDEVPLNRHDLRHKLEAEKMSCEDLEESNGKTASQALQKPQKKRVTFSIDVVPEEPSFEETTKPTLLDVSAISSLCAASCRTDAWYVLPDAQVLQAHCDDLKKMLASSPSLRIFVARSVLTSLAGHSRQQWRRLTRLEVQEPESASIVNSTSSADRMLNACMHLMLQRYHAVILTKVPEMHKRAKTLALHCFYIDEISLTPLAGNIFPDKLSLFPKSDEQTNKENTQLNKCNAATTSISFANEQTDILESLSSHSSSKGEMNRFRNLSVKDKNILEFDDRSVFEPLSIENATCNWPATKASDTSKWQLSKPQETSNFSNRPVVDEDKGQLSDAEIMTKLKSFCVSSKIVENRARSRIDEWICCLTQVMEDALGEVLMQATTVPAIASPPVLLAPWYLNEAVACVALCYRDVGAGRVAGILSLMLEKHSCTKYGRIKCTIQCEELLQLYGCCELLLENLLQFTPSLAPSLSRLTKVRRSLSKPTADVPWMSLLLDNHVAPTTRTLTDEHDHVRRNFVKKPSEVLQYLSQHFPEWRGVDEHTALKTMYHQEYKVIRAFGKDLKRLKITKNHQNNQPATEMTLDKDFDSNLEFIRKTNLIQSFGSKLQIKEPLDMDALDYEMESNEVNGSQVNDERMSELTDDSSTVGKSAILFVKEFLIEVGRALKDVHEFLSNGISKLLSGCDPATSLGVHRQALTLRPWLAEIKELLDSILSREDSCPGKMQAILATTVSPIEAAKMAASYRSAVRNCAEQSSILLSSLQQLCNN